MVTKHQLDNNNKTYIMENIEMIYLSEVELKETNGGSELSNWVWWGIGAMIGSMRYSTGDQFMLAAMGH